MDAGGLLPRRLRDLHRRVAHDAAPGPRNVRGRHGAEDDPGRVRLPAPVREGQPAPEVGGVPGPHQPGRVRFGDPGPYEYEHSEQVVEQLVRPTGLVDPEIEVRPTKNQIDDLLKEISERVRLNERCLVTTLTKRMAEDLADYLREIGIKVHYIHSDVETFERIDILRDLRLGVYDVVVGINLLREGLDLPEVSPRLYPRR